jgi:hypothetical protein
MGHLPTALRRYFSIRVLKSIRSNLLFLDYSAKKVKRVLAKNGLPIDVGSHNKALRLLKSLPQ